MTDNIRTALALMNSMILSGEDHSETSRGICDAAIKEADALPKWQPIETAPKDTETVAVWVSDWGTETAYFDADCALWRFTVEAIAIENEVTHWMPLPDGPEEGAL